jgi:circadian clock protein KaiC
VSERVSTGLVTLDKLIGGGFPRHSMVLLAGGPGVGKTILSAKYIHEGATKHGEPGLYVCFAETSRVLVSELLKFGWDFEALNLEKRVSILDLSIESEIDVQSALNQILDAITSLHARRLVIDSITAMSIGLRSEVEKRHVLHLLYKLIQKSGCTTIMIMEMPWGTTSIGNCGEAFIADGIILMENYYNNEGVLRRQLRILKMRGTAHTHKTHEYNIGKNGININV